MAKPEDRVQPWKDSEQGEEVWTRFEMQATFQEAHIMRSNLGFVYTTLLKERMGLRNHHGPKT